MKRANDLKEAELRSQGVIIESRRADEAEA
ncbi:hypothetical protein SAMN05216178_6896 [Pseudomonas saponiphila]|uniref:Uncharacterized protein n=1 Tax=Pseudomonas saponiphila TaxID=556534 RepID=A0A1H4ZYL1_9PSED|nr:hypothetical protein SAMN05216178_6896 [Pseudomonas saponiphila]